MPELPEVETIKRELERNILNKTFLTPFIYNKKAIQTPIVEFKKELNNLKIVSIDRVGKYIIINLDNKHKLLFHLRMEGKLFVVNKNDYSEKHLSIFFPFDDDSGLAFYDTRKFGVVYYLQKDELGPLKNVGIEPSKIKDDISIYNKIHKSNKYIKEILLDQSIIAGLGNIYADEVLYSLNISPFKKGNLITLLEVKKIISKAKEIFELAIENNGSTIRSYQASQKIHGSFQDFLKVYGKKGELCNKCNNFKIEKRRVGGRGTHYCPKCQNTGINIALSGLIASGKTTILSVFKNRGYLIFNSDNEVNNLYKDKNEVSLLKKYFPVIFNNDILDKNKLIDLLINDSSFYNKYESYIFKKIKEKINTFIIQNDNKNKIFEIPLLFNTNYYKDFTYLLGVESKHNYEYLASRDIDNYKKKIQLNEKNKFNQYKNALDYLILNDLDLDNLRQKVNDIINEIENKYYLT